MYYQGHNLLYPPLALDSSYYYAGQPVVGDVPAGTSYNGTTFYPPQSYQGPVRSLTEFESITRQQFVESEDV